MRYLKIIFFLLFYMHKPLAAEEIHNVNDITYDWLVKNGGERGRTEYVSIFQKIFKKTKVKNLLEFGMGYSTKYFLDSCTKVISVEFVSNGYGPGGYHRYAQLLRECPNWVPIVFFTGYSQDTSWIPYKYLGTDSVYKAWAYQGATHKNYALIDDFYIAELNAFIKNLLKARSIDVAFVNPALLLRGDLVQLCFNRIPIIVANNTFRRSDSFEVDDYGYSRVVVPEDYEEIFMPLESGLTVWVKKNSFYEGVIEELMSYAKTF